MCRQLLIRVIFVGKMQVNVFGLLCFFKETHANVVFIRWSRVLAVRKVKVQIRKFVEVNI